MKHRRIVIQRCILGFYNDEKERLYNLFLCFSFHSISLLFHKNNRRLFASLRGLVKHRRIVVQRCILGFYNDEKERLYNLFLCFSFY